ncbi:hypothetical protein CYMTET_51621, partial [Cymbomonas tetramitiformis]
GIRLARIDLNGLKTLPQLDLPSDPRRSGPEDVKYLAHHYLLSEKARIKKIKDAPSRLEAERMVRQTSWRMHCMQMASEYDLAHLGGFTYLRERPGLRKNFEELALNLFPLPTDGQPPSANQTLSVEQSSADEAQQDSA